jgi:hypothetical protein
MTKSTPTPAHPNLELLLSIGGVVGLVVLEAPHPDFAREVQRRFLGFTLPCAPHVERAFSVRLSCAGSPVKADAAGTPLPLQVRSSSREISVDRWDFRVQLQRGAGPDGFTGAHPGALTFVGRGEVRPVIFAFESLLRVLWSALLPRAGGALFHACGFADAGRGILAPGPSGAGKTTLARKVPEEDVMSDEVVALSRGADGGWRLSATPFFGELQRGGHSMRSFPLGGIAFLEKRAELGMEPLGTSDAVMRALGCLMCFETDQETAERNFALVVALCQQVPTFIAGSRADTPLPQLLQAMAPCLSLTADAAAPPENTRELVSALRANLRRHGRYAFQPRGASMRPFVQSGDAIFVETVAEQDVRAGDVVLYWKVGRTPERDSLICHRMISRLVGDQAGTLYLAKGDSLAHVETFETGHSAELIGRVRAVSRAGQAWAVPGRVSSLGILAASLAALPLLSLLKMVPRR